MPELNYSGGETLTGSYTVVVPAWNESKLVKETLQNIKQAMETQRFNGQIVVVDNNSTDDTATIATQAGATVVFEPINQIARARNAGAQTSTSNWLVFVDADTHINHNLLEHTLLAMASGSVIGGGSTVSFDGSLRVQAKILVSVWNWWSVRSRTAAGCYVYCTREAYDLIGGFDEQQYVAEELYFSKALRKLAGKRQQEFLIISDWPVVSSARKFDWFSTRQKLSQAFLLLIPGASKSKKMCSMWYDRSKTKHTQAK